MATVPKCQLCGSEMKKTTKRSGTALGLIIALLVILVGVFVSVAAFPCGLALGVPLIILAMFMGGKKIKVWQCRGCKTIVNRG